LFDIIKFLSKLSPCSVSCKNIQKWLIKKVFLLFEFLNWHFDKFFRIISKFDGKIQFIMFSIGIDIGGTKISSAIFDQEGNIIKKDLVYLEKKGGREAGKLVQSRVINLLDECNENNRKVNGIGISVPGIAYPETGRVWVPNIPGWEDYPLLDEIISAVQNPAKKIIVSNDRACSLLGEVWKGNARGCRNVITLLVGTGIGAGIMVNGNIVNGHGGAAGAVGWLALDRPFKEEYMSCGCFEYQASGNGIAKVARDLILKNVNYMGVLRDKPLDDLSSHDVFSALSAGDLIARKVIYQAIECWGMTVANLVSIFNPEKIILAGGVFGPALAFLEDIYKEALKWAQPVSIKHVTLESSALGSEAVLFGAGWLGLTVNGK
jgi:glucokinase